MIIDNLTINALKFTPTGGTVRLSIRSLVSEQWQIEVEDNGIGIPKDQQVLIFDRFFQINPTLSDTQGPVMANSGIGLALCQELVKVLGGSIDLESKTGEGSLFRICLPTLYPELPKESLSAARYQELSNNRVLKTKDYNIDSSKSFGVSEVGFADAEKPLILIIEDNEDIL